jgi:hypothetical protein
MYIQNPSIDSLIMANVSEVTSTYNAKKMNILALISESIRMPFINPEIADSTKLNTIISVSTKSSHEDSKPARYFRPPEIESIPAPKEAAIPATKA